MAARDLISARIPPELVSWQSTHQKDLFGDSDLSEPIKNKPVTSIPTTNAPETNKIRVSANFMAQIRQASYYIDPNYPSRKWGVFYALLWQLTYKDNRILTVKTHPDVMALTHMCKAVNRDKHKMKAFVRFQRTGKFDVNAFFETLNKTQKKNGAAKAIAHDEYFTCWFEPEHTIVESIAPFFVKRFTAMTWSILTPHGCAHWDQDKLRLSSGIAKPKIEQDQFETFWKAYYCNIFNPARLKENAMRNEMPKKYWKYLPEAVCIAELARGAAASSDNMLKADQTNSQRIRSRHQGIAQQQDQLRINNQS